MKTKSNAKPQRNAAIVSLYQHSHPTLSMAEIGEMFSVSKQRIKQILNRARVSRSCQNCYHLVGGNLCACREPEDIVRSPNKCYDWTPRK